MPMCTKDKIEFGRFGRRVIEANFSGGEPNSDGGLLLLRQVDHHLVLSRMAAAALANKNAPILWVVMTRGEAFDPRHVSVKPGASVPTPAATPAQRATNPSRSRHQARRCCDRSDRQRASSTNPWWEARGVADLRPFRSVRVRAGGLGRASPPLGGSHLSPHCKRITRSVQQGRLQRSSRLLRSCPSTPPALASTANQHRDLRRRIQIQLAEKRKSLQRIRRRFASA